MQPARPDTVAACGLVVELGAGRSVPRLHCERCGRAIETLAAGGVVWSAEDTDESATVVILCKTIDRSEPGCLSSDEVRPLPWLGLDRYMGLLLWNMRIRTRRDLEDLLAKSDPLGL
jgi:hypothetical protein